MNDALAEQEDNPERDVFRAECYCGWKGLDRKHHLEAIRDAQKHQKDTGHYLDSDNPANQQQAEE